MPTRIKSSLIRMIVILMALFASVQALKLLLGATAAPGDKAGIQWVKIPGGSFMMGSDTGSSDEKPAHRVSVKPFQFAKTDISINQTLP